MKFANIILYDYEAKAICDMLSYLMGDDYQPYYKNKRWKVARSALEDIQQQLKTNGNFSLTEKQESNKLFYEPESIIDDHG